MAMVINNNTMAANTTRILNTNYKELGSSIEKLSSGMRINRAADDAAGLAVSELMRSDVSSLNQGIRNANDAISLIQTADGAMQVIDEKLIRMKELAEQASTGTYDDVQRGIIDSEYQQMASEITRISNSTDFNGHKLLDGTMSGKHSGIGKDADGGLNSTGKLKVHFGPTNDCKEDYYYIEIGNVSASALGIGNNVAGTKDGHSISTQDGAAKALGALEAAITSKDNIRAHLGGLQNRLEASVANLEVQSENMQAAESRIRDVDVATEMTKFTKNQILTQSAVSMLSQANSMPQMAQQLIG